jgi:hypothetical protein
MGVRHERVRRRGEGGERKEAGGALAVDRNSKRKILLWCFLQPRAFFGDDRPLHRTDLQTNAAINAGCKVNPVPIGAFGIFARAGMDAGNGAGIYAVGNAFADVCNDRMRHSILSKSCGFSVVDCGKESR